MIRFHKEGHKIIAIGTVVSILFGLTIYRIWPDYAIPLITLLILLLGLILQFFRNPIRKIEEVNNSLVYAPADGKVVVIEETVENEYFKDKRIQVSIFMSPINVHVNRHPVGGKISYVRYHPGKYLVAWHPKSSTENERSTVVINNGKVEILIRQIAGALARRIKTYSQQGQEIVQGSELGFIKFGSRVDIFLPLNSKINVVQEEKVKGNQTIIASLQN